MTIGFLGEFFASLSFASAFVAMAAFFFAEKTPEIEARDRSAWSNLGNGAFITHIASVLGIVFTLFGMIYTHQYAYHYVWSHSSNELPVYYMISCFWEGQEGSFLLWCFWHSVLGGLLLWKLRHSEWRNLVLATIASVELILSSMLLGVFVSKTIVLGIFALMLVLPAATLLTNAARRFSTFSLATLFIVLTTGILLLRAQNGFYSAWSLSNAFSSVSGIAFTLFLLATVGYGIYLLLQLRPSLLHTPSLFAGFSVLTVAVSALFFEATSWKIGSTPFITLINAIPNAEVFKSDPNFIPKNGTGLNPLLQNYWMVIHPPTLFLGFASTVVPFAFVLAGLMKRKYTEWIKPATPYMLFSAMILGIGIIMGGYWAYETLNFGGYWNWDPVENASFVPWLTAVASLHAILIHQKTKGYLSTTLILVISTFLLVLYSTFLTRSGILGETSVHTFTDLGLSGQLLVLLLAYVVGIGSLLANRWRELPRREDESSAWSAEFLLFLGLLVFIFSSAEILFATSLPVFNKIFGTTLAPPVQVQLFYYKWNVWFAIGFGVFSGCGQFLWWNRKGKKTIADALYRPFVAAMLAGTLILLAFVYFRMEFAYAETFRNLISDVSLMHQGIGGKISAYLTYGVMGISDELMLFAALFALFANADVLIAMLRRNRKSLKTLGGSITHIGFALMLLGILFSSGYDSVISKSLTPEDLAGFAEKDKVDNVLLVRNEPRAIYSNLSGEPEYIVTYLGKKQATPPFSDFEIIERNEESFKIRFRDSQDEQYGFVMPLQVFLQGKGKHTNQPTANAETPIDLDAVNKFLVKNIQFLRDEIPMINSRTLFGVKFQDAQDTSKSFVLYPESQMNEDMGSILSHPSRKITWERDVYTYVSSVPKEEDKDKEEKFKYFDLKMKVGDTAQAQNAVVRLNRVFDVRDQLAERDSLRLAVAAEVQVITGRDTLVANPVYLIDIEGKPRMIEANLPALGLDFAFVGANPQDKTISIQMQQRNNQSDWIVLKAIQKPYINLLWLGTFILVFGFLIAIYRRATM